MDSELRGIIFDGDIYFERNPLDLFFKVFSAKKVVGRDGTEELFVIDENSKLWLLLRNEDGDEDAVVPFLITSKIKVIDVTRNNGILVLLSERGDLYHVYIHENIDIRSNREPNIKIMDMKQKFKYINSGESDILVAIDREGNLWCDDQEFLLGAPAPAPTERKLIQCTSGIDFIQAEFGRENLVCLDSEGVLYVVGTNQSDQLCCLNKPILKLTEVVNGTQFKKISVDDNYTALIDFDDNLWICGTPVFTGGRKDERLVKVLSNVKDVSVGPLYIIAQLLDDSISVMSYQKWIDERPANFNRNQFYIIDQMKADKLFNNMNLVEIRFGKTKLAME